MNRKLQIYIGIIIVGVILVSIFIFYESGLDDLQKIYSVVGSLSLFIALATYFYKKRQDKNAAAIEQIAFFRKEIINEWDYVIKEIKLKNSQYRFPNIKLDEPTIKFMREKYPTQFKSQNSVFLKDLSNFKISSVIWDADILDKQVKLFNMLEDFSLRVYHFKTNQHQALNSVRYAFIEVIEKNAAALIFMRDVKVGKPIYSTVLWLYNYWKENVDRETSLIKRLEKYEFITKKQREKIFQDIRDSRKSIE